MQYSDGNESGDIEPNCYVDMTFAPFDDGTEHVDTKNHPYYSDQDIDRPF